MLPIHHAWDTLEINHWLIHKLDIYSWVWTLEKHTDFNDHAVILHESFSTVMSRHRSLPKQNLQNHSLHLHGRMFLVHCRWYHSIQQYQTNGWTFMYIALYYTLYSPTLCYPARPCIISITVTICFIFRKYNLVDLFCECTKTETKYPQWDVIQGFNFHGWFYNCKNQKTWKIGCIPYLLYK